MPNNHSQLSLSRPFSRRGLILGAGAAGLVASLGPRPAFALTADQARALIDQVVAEVNRVINSGQSERAMYTEFERIFGRYADVPVIAQSVLGPAARQASQAELRDFASAYTGYLARTYGRYFREIIGASIEVTGSRPVRSFYEVSSIAYLRGREPFEVFWHVSDRSGRDLFFNLMVEGVNLLATQRTEIGSMLDRRRGDIRALISDLNAQG